MESKPVSAAAARIDAAYREMERGASSESVLKVLDPLLEKRLGVLLDGFRQCPPELGPLLDFRASICELWRMRKELKDAGKIGKSAAAVLEALVTPKSNAA
jgi:hypothetical protein